MKTCHNMNIIVQTAGGDASPLNGKSEISNETLANITRDILLKSIQNKYIWCFAYQYSIWISHRNENILRGDVPSFLWNGSRPSYKHIKIWGLRVYTINGLVTINKLGDRSNNVYLMIYAATTGVIIYCNPCHNFPINRSHHAWFYEYNYRLYTEDKHTPGYLLIQQYPGIILHNLDLINLIPCELGLTSTLFRDATMITYEIDLPTSGNKVGLNLLDDEYFTIPYVIYTTQIHHMVINFQHRLIKCVDHWYQRRRYHNISRCPWWIPAP